MSPPPPSEFRPTLDIVPGPRAVGQIVLSLVAAIALLYYGRLFFITVSFALFLAFAMRPTGSIPRFYDQLRQQGFEPPLDLFKG